MSKFLCNDYVKCYTLHITVSYNKELLEYWQVFCCAQLSFIYMFF